MTWNTIQLLLHQLGHLGWIPPDERTEEMHEAHRVAMASMLPFPLVSDPLPTGFKLMLTDSWKHRQTIKALGRPFTGSHQNTGSCVNSGAMNACMMRLVLNVLMFGLAQKIVVPFTLVAYGKSRQFAGMRGRGEGSLGSTMAKAMREVGMIDAADSSLPKYTADSSKGFDYPAEVELQFSDGAALPAKLLDLADDNLIGATAELHNTQEMSSAILNFNPVTRAHMNWAKPGTERLEGSGSAEVVIGEHNGEGGHQMTCDGVWQHPTLGLLFHETNNWGLDVYRTDPSTGTGSGYWVKESVEDRAMRQRYAEHFAYAGPAGFVQADPTWRIL